MSQPNQPKNPSLLSSQSIPENIDMNSSVHGRNQSKFDGLTQTHIYAYGVGHFLNDLMAACYFNYLFFYLKRVVKTDAAPSALLAGQIADGIATPLVGYFSDRTNSKFGKRTPWYVVGLIIVVCCYIPIYQSYNSDNKTNQYLFYTFFIVMINIGWAAVQISHMSLVPSLTCSRKRRDRLNNLRNTFTFISNLIVLGVGVIIFSFMKDPKLEYAIISYILLAIGLVSCGFFLYKIRQVQLTQICKQKIQKLKLSSKTSQIVLQNQKIEQNGEQKIQKIHSIFDWFKMPKFYLFGVCYMGVRLYTNMFGTFLPFYLIGVLKLGTGEDRSDQSQVPFTVALVPLIVYLFSVLASLRLNWFYTKFGRKSALSTGTVICVLSLGSMLFLHEGTGWVMYIIAVFVGISQTMVLSTGINFISDVVGTKDKDGAFVFGIYSLLDKVSAGLAIYFVASSSAYTKQHLSQLTQYQISFIRYTMVLIPSLACILASLIVITYPIEEYKKKNELQTGDQTEREKIRTNSIQDQLII